MVKKRWLMTNLLFEGLGKEFEADAITGCRCDLPEMRSDFDENGQVMSLRHRTFDAGTISTVLTPNGKDIGKLGE
jgi:anthranilate synthase component 2